MRLKDRQTYLLQAGRLAWNILFRGRHTFAFDLLPAQAKGMPWRKRTNLVRTGANLIYRRTHPWAWPFHMQIELTNYCDLKCSVCPTGLGLLKRKRQSMDPALFQRLMDEVGPYLLTASLWGWGEPLLHPKLPDILRLARDRGVTTLLSTNGQTLNDEKIRQALIEYPPTYLIVCLDGVTEDTNSVFRVGASLEPALSGVRRLAEEKHKRGALLPILHHRFIVMKHNEHQIKQLALFGAENQFDSMSLRSLAIIDAPEDGHRQLIPSGEDYRAYDYKNGKRISRRDFICEKAFAFPTVFADGSVVACDQDFNGQLVYGSLEHSSFAEVWWGKRAREVRRMIRDAPQEISVCRNCPFRDRPVSNCSIKYFDLKKPSPSQSLT